jgi:hypothetical protein
VEPRGPSEYESISGHEREFLDRIAPSKPPEQELRRITD